MLCGVGPSTCSAATVLTEFRLRPAQLHISGLFPRKRGLISSIFVAGFTGSCIIFYILQKIFEDLGSTQ